MKGESFRYIQPVAHSEFVFFPFFWFFLIWTVRSKKNPFNNPGFHCVLNLSAKAHAVIVDEVASTSSAASEDTEELYYRILSNDRREFRVSEKAIQQSETLNTLVGAMDFSKEELEEKTFPIDNCDGATLELVFKWCEEHKGEPIPVEDDSVPKQIVIPKFDEELMQIDDDALFDLARAAGNLNIKQLINVTCKKLALMAKGKSPEELRVFFGIPTDEEDEAAEKAAKEKEEAEKAAKEAVGEGTSYA